MPPWEKRIPLVRAVRAGLMDGNRFELACVGPVCRLIRGVAHGSVGRALRWGGLLGDETPHRHI